MLLDSVCCNQFDLFVFMSHFYELCVTKRQSQAVIISFIQLLYFKVVF